MSRVRKITSQLMAVLITLILVYGCGGSSDEGTSPVTPQVMYDLHTSNMDTDGDFEGIGYTLYNDGGIKQTGYSVDDLDNDGTYDSFSVLHYDPSGEPLEYVVNIDRDNDGVFDERETGLYTYDAAGNLLTESTSTDLDLDGIRNSGVDIEYTYDDAGHQLSTKTSVESDGDPQFEAVYYIEDKYYAEVEGLLPYKLATDNNGDGIQEWIITSSYVFDAAGHIISIREERDQGGDGIVDDVILTTNTRDPQGNLTKGVFEVDYGADGIIDQRSTTQYDNSYDGFGSLIEVISSRDGDDDGTIDSVRTIQSSYDDAGNMLTEKYLTDSNADGSIDSWSQYTFSYDVNGNRVFLEGENDLNANGIVEFTSVETYDATGKTRSLTQTSYNDVSGLPGRTTHVEWDYDADGNLLNYLEELDFDGDGVLDTVRTTNGRLVAEWFWLDEIIQGLGF